MQEHKLSARQTVKDFLRPIKTAKRSTFLSMINDLFFALFATYSVVFLQNISKAIEQHDIRIVWRRAIIWVVILTIKTILAIFSKGAPLRALRNVNSYLYDLYMKQIFLGDNTKIEKLGTGRTISIVQKGMSAHMDLISELIWGEMEKFGTLALALIFIGSKNLPFFFVGMGVVVFGVVRIFWFYPRASHRRSKGKRIDTDIDRIAVMHVMSKFEILQHGKLQEETDKIREKCDERCTYKIKEKMWQGISYEGSGLLFVLFIIGVAVYVGFGVFKGTYLFSDFILLTGLAGLLSAQVNRTLTIAKKFSDCRVHIEKLWDLLQDIKPIRHIQMGEKFVYKKGDVQTDGLCFSYGSRKVFENFSVKITGGKKTAIVGPSGGGKTTLIKLIAGYINPDGGNILIDDQDLSITKLSDYYHHIGYLTQEPSVFDGTIYENLVYAVAQKPDEKTLTKAIKNAQCQFIYDFKHGLDTEIGEKGIRLSGGQRQRLAIAKIFLKDPEIILLDEPTSALDSFSEEEVSKAFTNLFKGRTVIVVAHRLQTVKRADDIIVIDKGETIERGTHHELIKLGGYYKKMLDLQSGF